MTGNGKIARLPHNIRLEVNRRLQDGQHQKRIASWLNSLPEVKVVLAADFDNEPISQQNISQWKNHGFRDWLDSQQALDLVHSLDDESSLGHKDLASRIPEKFAHWVALQYAVHARTILASESRPQSKWLRLRELCADACRLRKGDLLADRLSVERDWLAFSKSKADREANMTVGMSEQSQREIEEEFGLFPWLKSKSSSTDIPTQSDTYQNTPENLQQPPSKPPTSEAAPLTEPEPPTTGKPKAVGPPNNDQPSSDHPLTGGESSDLSCHSLPATVDEGQRSNQSSEEKGPPALQSTFEGVPRCCLCTNPFPSPTPDNPDPCCPHCCPNP